MQNILKYINLSWAVVGICEGSHLPLSALVHEGDDMEETVEHYADVPAGRDDMRTRYDKPLCHVFPLFVVHSLAMPRNEIRHMVDADGNALPNGLI